MKPPQMWLFPTSSTAKDLGAYYTEAPIATFLAEWALRTPQDRVLDPCFGGGVFLRAAAIRLQQLGANPAAQVFGVEVDSEAFADAGGRLIEEFGLHRANLKRADFFSIAPTSHRIVDAVIGNPPFIRYQRFTGSTRQLALARSSAQGVRLSELTSSWAPFLVHAISMIREGGRLAIVLPMELGYAKYARPVLEHLRDSFAATTFLTFREKLFPQLSEDTLLLLGEDKGGGGARFAIRDFAHPSQLGSLAGLKAPKIPNTRQIDADEIASGAGRLIEHLLNRRERELYRELRKSARTVKLGELATIGIGYVTGANKFFHLSPEAAENLGIPTGFLRRAVRKGRALSGLRFTLEDWAAAAERGYAGWLLHIDGDRPLPASINNYLARGDTDGISRAYKCRMRSPWYSVPHVYQPDAFVTYMSGATPRFVANHSDAVAPNTLHVVRLQPSCPLDADCLSVLWHTSLTGLSVELEGHALGGGMLKLEPSEAANVLLPWAPHLDRPRMIEMAGELDRLIRAGDRKEAQRVADQAVLRDELGISVAECELLRSAASRLRRRRGYVEKLNGTA